MKKFPTSKLAIFILFALVGFLLYFPSLKGEFIFDDYGNIALNPVITNLNESFSKIFQTRGLVRLSFALNYHFFRLNPFSYHIINVAIHVFSSFLVYLFLLLTLQTPFFKKKRMAAKPQILALLASLFFLVHPLQSQAVAYLTQRYESTCALFYLLTLVLYLQARLSPKKKRQVVFIILSVISGLLASSSKEIALTLPLAVLLLELTFFNQIRKAVRFLLPYLLIWIKIGFFYFYSLMMVNKLNPQGFLQATTALHGKIEITRFNYLLTQINVIPLYLRLVFLPWGQRVDWDFSLTKNFFQWPTPFSGTLLLTIIILAGFLWWKKYRLASFGIFFFFLNLLISSSLIPIADLVFEHRVYLSMAGTSFFLAELISLIWPRINRKILTGSLLIILIILSGLTLKRAWLWGNKFYLWQDNYQKSPDKARVNKNFGAELTKTGEVKTGLSLLRKAVEIDPDQVEYQNALAVTLDENGYLQEAEKEYQQSLKINDQAKDIFFLLGNLQVRLEKPEEAVDNFEKALILDPNYEPAYTGLCSAYGKLKQFDLAIYNCQKSLVIDPNLGAPHYNLYVLYTVLGNQEKARYHQEKARTGKKTFRQKTYY